MIGLEEVVVVGVWVKCVTLVGVDALVDQSQVDLLRILHDSLAGIIPGLGAIHVDTTGGLMDEMVSLELELLEDLGIIMQ